MRWKCVDGARVSSNGEAIDWLPDMELFTYGLAWWRLISLHTKDVRNDGRTMREAKKDLVERQSILLAGTGGILDDSRLGAQVEIQSTTIGALVALFDSAGMAMLNSAIY